MEGLRSLPVRLVTLYVRRMRFWAIADEDEAIELYVRREDAERFLEDVRGDDEELAASLRLEPTDLDT